MSPASRTTTSAGWSSVPQRVCIAKSSPEAFSTWPTATAGGRSETSIVTGRAATFGSSRTSIGHTERSASSSERTGTPSDLIETVPSALIFTALASARSGSRAWAAAPGREIDISTATTAQHRAALQNMDRLRFGTRWEAGIVGRFLEVFKSAARSCHALWSNFNTNLEDKRRSSRETALRICTLTSLAERRPWRGVRGRLRWLTPAETPAPASARQPRAPGLASNPHIVNASGRDASRPAIPSTQRTAARGA